MTESLREDEDYGRDGGCHVVARGNQELGSEGVLPVGFSQKCLF